MPDNEARRTITGLASTTPGMRVSLSEERIDAKYQKLLDQQAAEFEKTLAVMKSALESIERRDDISPYEREKLKQLARRRMETARENVAQKPASAAAYRALAEQERHNKTVEDEITGMRKELLADAQTRNQMLESVTNRVVSVDRNIVGIVSGAVNANPSQILGGTKGILDDVEGTMKMLDEHDIGGGIFAKGGKAMQILAKAKGVLTVAGGILTAAGMAGELIDLEGNMRSVSLNMTGSDANMGIMPSMNMEKALTSYLTQLSDRDVELIQNTLVRNRAKYGTQEYQQGMNFAVSATRQYGISAQNASQLYANAVLKGTMTVDQLNTALDALQETVKNTDITMDKALENLSNAVDSLKALAGSEGAATEWASEYASLFGNSEQSVVASKMVSDVSSKVGSYQFNQMVAEYQQQHEGTSTAEAALAVSMQFMENNGEIMYQDARMNLYRYPIKDGKRFFDYVNAGDKEGLVEALKYLDEHATAGLNRGQVTRAMVLMGIDEAVANDDEELAEWWIGSNESGQYGFADNATIASSAIANTRRSEKATEDELASSEQLRDAIRYRYISEESAKNLTKSQLEQIEQVNWIDPASVGEDEWLGEQQANQMDLITTILNTSDAASRASAIRQEVSVKVELGEDAAKVLYATVQEQGRVEAANGGEG